MQSDYPYGRYDRCQRRVWVETHPKHGMRFCTQTNQPGSPNTWNKPKKGTYIHFVAMLLDKSNGYIHPYSLGLYTTREEFQPFWNCFYQQLDQAGQECIDWLGRMLVKNLSLGGYHKAEVHQGKRIEVQIDWFYDKGGLIRYIYANQVAVGSPDDLPVVSIQRYRKQGNGEEVLVDLVSSRQITPDVIAEARQIVTWDVVDYPKAHWCYSVLRGFRGFEHEGQPIYELVRPLLTFGQRKGITQADQNAFQQQWKQVWDAAEAYWEAKVAERLDAAHEQVSPPVGATYNISHATCQN